jgi:YidC/Oxa1 family membrane protein insertase
VLRPLEEIFLQILSFFHHYTGSYGWDIILLTLLIRIILFPVMISSIKSMKRMQKLQPFMKEIQAKYKDNKEKLNQEILKLYKEHGLNPMSTLTGCLPMFLQLPVFWALFQVLRDPSANGYMFINAKFLGMDLTTAAFTRLVPGFLDNIYLVMPGMVDLSPIAAFTGIGYFKDAYLYLPTIVLVVGFVLTMYFQQKMMQVDPNQQSMMVMMNVMFTFLAFSMPSGVLLYWDISNVLQIVQQKFTGGPMAKPPGPATKGAAKASQPAKAAPEAKSPKPAPEKSEPKSPKQGPGAAQKKRRRKRKR